MRLAMDAGRRFQVMSGRSVSVQSSQAGEVRVKLAELLPQLRLRALKLCRDRDAADDLLQETALRALSFESSYRADTNLKAWLYQILFSVFITRCRRRRRSGRFLAEHASDPNLWCSATEPARPNEGLSPPVQRAIRSLPEHFGKVVVLVDLQELSYSEAAQELGVPIGTVMSRLHRGRRLLASELAEVSANQAQQSAA
jgi:RNA polymerase sigma-70 factor (ECF subfamily)